METKVERSLLDSLESPFEGSAGITIDDKCMEISISGAGLVVSPPEVLSGHSS